MKKLFASLLSLLIVVQFAVPAFAQGPGLPPSEGAGTFEVMTSADELSLVEAVTAVEVAYGQLTEQDAVDAVVAAAKDKLTPETAEDYTVTFTATSYTAPVSGTPGEIVGKFTVTDGETPATSEKNKTIVVTEGADPAAVAKEGLAEVEAGVTAVFVPYGSILDSEDNTDVIAAAKTAVEAAAAQVLLEKGLTNYEATWAAIDTDEWTVSSDVATYKGRFTVFKTGVEGDTATSTVDKSVSVQVEAPTAKTALEALDTYFATTVELNSSFANETEENVRAKLVELANTYLGTQVGLTAYQVTAAEDENFTPIAAGGTGTWVGKFTAENTGNETDTATDTSDRTINITVGTVVPDPTAAAELAKVEAAVTAVEVAYGALNQTAVEAAITAEIEKVTLADGYAASWTTSEDGWNAVAGTIAGKFTVTDGAESDPDTATSATDKTITVTEAADPAAGAKVELAKLNTLAEVTVALPITEAATNAAIQAAAEALINETDYTVAWDGEWDATDKTSTGKFTVTAKEGGDTNTITGEEVTIAAKAEKTAKPTFADGKASAKKEKEDSASVTYTLEAATFNTIYKVYNNVEVAEQPDKPSENPADGIIATLNGTTLTVLRTDGEPLKAGKYWLTATATGMAESDAVEIDVEEADPVDVYAEGTAEGYASTNKFTVSLTTGTFNKDTATSKDNWEFTGFDATNDVETIALGEGDKPTTATITLGDGVLAPNGTYTVLPKDAAIDGTVKAPESAITVALLDKVAYEAFEAVKDSFGPTKAKVYVTADAAEEDAAVEALEKIANALLETGYVVEFDATAYTAPANPADTTGKITGKLTVTVAGDANKDNTYSGTLTDVPVMMADEDEVLSTPLAELSADTANGGLGLLITMAGGTEAYAKEYNVKVYAKNNTLAPVLTLDVTADELTGTGGVLYYNIPLSDKVVAGKEYYATVKAISAIAAIGDSDVSAPSGLATASVSAETRGKELMKALNAEAFANTMFAAEVSTGASKSTVVSEIVDASRDILGAQFGDEASLIANIAFASDDAVNTNTPGAIYVNGTFSFMYSSALVESDPVRVKVTVVGEQLDPYFDMSFASIAFVMSADGQSFTPANEQRAVTNIRDGGAAALTALSLDESVATAKYEATSGNVVITPVGPGTTTVVVTYGTRVGQIAVSVSKNLSDTTVGIQSEKELTGGKLVLAAGESTVVHAQVDPAVLVFSYEWQLTGANVGDYLEIVDRADKNSVVVRAKKAVPDGVELGLTVTVYDRSGWGETSDALKVTTTEAPVTALTLDQLDALLYVGGSAGSDTITVAPVATPSRDWVPGTSDWVTFSSSKATVATVDASGKIIAVGAGTATITATADKSETNNKNIKATIKVTVVKYAEKLEIIPSDSKIAKVFNNEYELLVGKTLKFKLSDTKASVQWVSDTPDVVSVDSKGTVKALSAQNDAFAKAQISVYADGALAGRVSFRVVEGTNTVAFAAKSVSYEVGAAPVNIYESGIPAGVFEIFLTMPESSDGDDAYTAALQRLVFTSNKAAVAKVEAGQLVIGAKGKATITATDPLTKKKASITVNVVQTLTEATEIHKDPGAKVKHYEYAAVGASGALKVTFNTGLAKSAAKEVKWTSSDPEIISVNNAGTIKVLAHRSNPVTITAALVNHPEQKVQWTINTFTVPKGVAAYAYTDTTGNKKTTKLALDNYLNYYGDLWLETAAGEYPRGNVEWVVADGGNVGLYAHDDWAEMYWLRGASKATKVTAYLGGADTTKVLGGKTFTYTITTKGSITSRNDFWWDDNSDYTLLAGKNATEDLSKLLKIADGITQKSVKYSVVAGSNVVSVSSKGMVKAKLATGSAIVRATIDGVWTLDRYITVDADEETKVVLYYGTNDPGNANAISGNKVGVPEGEARDVLFRLYLNGKPVTPNSVSLKGTAPGGLTVAPCTKAGNLGLTISATAKIAAPIDLAAEVAFHDGTTNRSIVVEFTVADGTTPADLAIAEAYFGGIGLAPNKSLALNVAALDKDGDKIADSTFRWSIDDAQVATVAANAADSTKATLKASKTGGYGEATLTVTHVESGMQKTFNVAVLNPATKVTARQSSFTLKAGEQAYIFAEATYKDNNYLEYDGRIEWTLPKDETNVKIVSQDGQGGAVIEGVTATKAVTLTATNPSSGKKATVKVTVIATDTVKTRSVTFAKGDVLIAPGKTGSQKATVKDTNGSTKMANKNLLWTISGDSDIWVDATGKVFVDSDATPGDTAVVTAIALDSLKAPEYFATGLVNDDAKMASYTVTVGVAPKKLSLAWNSSSSGTIEVGETATFDITTNPVGASRDFTFSSSNPKVATVTGNDKTGTVTANAPGTAVITVRSANGKVGTITVSVRAKTDTTATINNSKPTSGNAISTVATTYGEPMPGYSYQGTIAAGATLTTNDTAITATGNPFLTDLVTDTFASNNLYIKGTDGTNDVYATNPSLLGGKYTIGTVHPDFFAAIKAAYVSYAGNDGWAASQIKLVQRNKALSGAYPDSEEFKGNVKTKTYGSSVIDELAANVDKSKAYFAFIIPDKSVAPTITFEAYLVVDGKADVPLATLTYANTLTFEGYLSADKTIDPQSNATPKVTVDKKGNVTVALTADLSFGENGLAGAQLTEAAALFGSTFFDAATGLPTNPSDKFNGQYAMVSLDLRDIVTQKISTGAADETFTIKQTNAALEMFQDDGRVKEENGKWVKTATYPVAGFMSDAGTLSLVMLSKGIMDGTKTIDNTVTLVLTNTATPTKTVTITLTGKNLTLAGYRVAPEVYETIEPAGPAAMETKVGPDTAGDVAVTLSSTGEIAYEDNKLPTPELITEALDLFGDTFFNANGQPMAGKNDGKYTMVTLDLSTIVEKNIKTDKADETFTIKQTNAALELFPTDPAVEEVNGKWVKEKSYPVEWFAGKPDGTLSFIVLGSDGTTDNSVELVLTNDGDATKTVTIKVDASGLTFADLLP